MTGDGCLRLLAVDATAAAAGCLAWPRPTRCGSRQPAAAAGARTAMVAAAQRRTPTMTAPAPLPAVVSRAAAGANALASMRVRCTAFKSRCASLVAATPAAAKQAGGPAKPSIIVVQRASQAQLQQQQQYHGGPGSGVRTPGSRSAASPGRARQHQHLEPVSAAAGAAASWRGSRIAGGTAAAPGMHHTRAASSLQRSISSNSEVAAPLDHRQRQRRSSPGGCISSRQR